MMVLGCCGCLKPLDLWDVNAQFLQLSRGKSCKKTQVTHCIHVYSRGMRQQIKDKDSVGYMTAVRPAWREEERYQD